MPTAPLQTSVCRPLVQTCSLKLLIQEDVTRGGVVARGTPLPGCTVSFDQVKLSALWLLDSVLTFRSQAFLVMDVLRSPRYHVRVTSLFTRMKKNGSNVLPVTSSAARCLFLVVRHLSYPHFTHQGLLFQRGFPLSPRVHSVNAPSIHRLGKFGTGYNTCIIILATI